MDIVEIERNKNIVNHINQINKYLLRKSDKKYLENLKTEAQLCLDSFNKENLTVKNPSVLETGKYKMVLKIVINAKYLKPIIDFLKQKVNYDYDFICNDCLFVDKDGEEIFDANKMCSSCKIKLKKHDKDIEQIYQKIYFINDEYKKAIEKTNFPLDLRNKWILLNRECKKKGENILTRSIKESITTEILNIFKEQNKNLINKY